MNPCWFKGHKWKIIAYLNYLDTSYGDNAESNNVTLQCEKCGNVKVKSNYAGGLIDKSNKL